MNSKTLPFATTAALAVAALWLWTNFCGFPWSAWNDLRLAPVFMAAHGVNPYAQAGAGIATTWLYGPVPLWLWWPATLAGDAVSAILAADALNLAYSLGAIAFACWRWPAAGASAAARGLALAMCIAAWPYSTFHYLQADNLAVAAGLVANTLLATRRPSSAARGWLIAVVTALALGSKQTALGLLAAQTAWLWSEHGRTAAFHHLARTLTVAAGLAVLAGAQFGFASLWLGAVRIPGALPWTSEPVARLAHLAPMLIVHVGGPLLLLAFTAGRVLRSGHGLRLPFFAWIASLALGLPSLMTVGGSTNSFHGFVLLLPPLAVAACAWAQTRRTWVFAGVAGLVVALIAARWTSQINRPLAPVVVAHQQAGQLCRLYPGQVWFPWHPTVTYFTDGRFYHAEDGLQVRRLTGHPLSAQQLKAGLPPHPRFVALLGPDWGIAKSFTHAPNQEQRFGHWELWPWKEP